MEGVTENKKKWLELAESTCTSGNCTNHDRTSIDQPDKEDDKHENIVVE